MKEHFRNIYPTLVKFFMSLPAYLCAISSIFLFLLLLWCICCIFSFPLLLQVCDPIAEIHSFCDPLACLALDFTKHLHKMCKDTFPIGGNYVHSRDEKRNSNRDYYTLDYFRLL